MVSIDSKLNIVVERFKKQGYAQVPGYNRFGYVNKTNKALVVSRENGKDTRIPFDKIVKAVDAIRENNSAYSNGPSALRKYGITHINSPIWALVHLLSLEEINN
jgi:hypothetical protein